MTDIDGYIDDRYVWLRYIWLRYVTTEICYEWDMLWLILWLKYVMTEIWYSWYATCYRLWCSINFVCWDRTHMGVLRDHHLFMLVWLTIYVCVVTFNPILLGFSSGSSKSRCVPLGSLDSVCLGAR